MKPSLAPICYRVCRPQKDNVVYKRQGEEEGVYDLNRPRIFWNRKPKFLQNKPTIFGNCILVVRFFDIVFYVHWIKFLTPQRRFHPCSFFYSELLLLKYVSHLVVNMWFCLSKQAPYCYIAKVLTKAKFENNPKRIWFVGTPKVNDLKKGDDMISPVVEQPVSKLRPNTTTRSWSVWRTPRRDTGPSPSRRSAPSILSSSSVCAPRRMSGVIKRINRMNLAECWSGFFLKEIDGEGQPVSSEWFYQHDEEPLPVRFGIEARGKGGIDWIIRSFLFVKTF